MWLCTGFVCFPTKGRFVMDPEVGRHFDMRRWYSEEVCLFKVRLRWKIFSCSCSCFYSSVLLGTLLCLRERLVSDITCYGGN